MNRALLLGTALSVALLPACGKKKDQADPAAAPGAAAEAPAGAGGAAPATAAGGEVAAIPKVADCAKSLAGQEKVERTITKACGPVTITADYDVEGTLIVEAGSVLQFQRGARLQVGYYGPAKLVVKGTAQEPVTFTVAGDKVAGEWAGVKLYKGAARSQLDGLILEWGGDDEGAIYVDAADVAVKNSTIRDAGSFGIFVADGGRLVDGAALKFERAGKIPASLPPASVAGLGTGHTFDSGTSVQVRPGRIEQDTAWQSPGAPLWVAGKVEVNGSSTKATLTIAAGTDLRFGSDGGIDVGYYNKGGLKVAGSADKPVAFRAAEDPAPGAWKGVTVYGNGEASVESALFEYGGSDDGTGVFAVDDRGKARLKNVTFKNNATGLSVTQAALLEGVESTTFRGNKLGAKVFGNHVAKLAATNTWEAGQVLSIPGGPIEAGPHAWSLQAGAEVHVTDELNVENKGQLTIPAGVELRFAEGKGITVGYYSEAMLKVDGTPDKPVVLRGERDDAASWSGIHIYQAARDSSVKHAVLDGAANDAAILVEDRGSVQVDSVTGKRVQALVGWTCQGKVTSKALKVEGGGKTERKPEGC
jgi:hypothetical protein